MEKRDLKTESVNFSDLYQNYNGMVRAVLFKFCGARDLDDLVQESFVSIWKGLSHFEGQSDIRTWIYRITVNVAYDYFRKQKKQNYEVEFKDHITPEVKNTTDDQQLIHKGLSTMNLKHRMVIVMFHFEGLSIKEIAEITDEPEGTIKSRLHFARSELRTFLETHGVKL